MPHRAEAGILRFLHLISKPNKTLIDLGVRPLINHASGSERLQCGAQDLCQMIPNTETDTGSSSTRYTVPETHIFLLEASGDLLGIVVAVPKRIVGRMTAVRLDFVSHVLLLRHKRNNE